MSDDKEKLPEPASQEDTLWQNLRRMTAARIGLKRAGASLATEPLLAFQLAHARARDAVHAPLDDARLASDLGELELPVLTVASAAEDRARYLMRPDLGRTLSPGAESVLAPHRGDYDIVFVVTDGLSARAVQTHAKPLLDGLVPSLREKGWRIAPVVVACQARVGIGDPIAATLNANCVVVLIGERPGLTTTDGMGAYLTWQPHPGTTDADRNCLSNIHPDGLGYAEAAFKLVHLLSAMRARKLSGVQLKDESGQLLIGEN